MPLGCFAPLRPWWGIPTEGSALAGMGVLLGHSSVLRQISVCRAGVVAGLGGWDERVFPLGYAGARRAQVLPLPTSNAWIQRCARYQYRYWSREVLRTPQGGISKRPSVTESPKRVLGRASFVGPLLQPRRAHGIPAPHPSPQGASR